MLTLQEANAILLGEGHHSKVSHPLAGGGQDAGHAVQSAYLSVMGTVGTGVVVDDNALIEVIPDISDMSVMVDSSAKRPYVATATLIGYSVGSVGYVMRTVQVRGASHRSDEMARRSAAGACARHARVELAAVRAMRPRSGALGMAGALDVPRLRALATRAVYGSRDGAQFARAGLRAQGMPVDTDIVDETVQNACVILLEWDKEGMSDKLAESVLHVREHAQERGQTADQAQSAFLLSCAITDGLRRATRRPSIQAARQRAAWQAWLGADPRAKDDNRDRARAVATVVPRGQYVAGAEEDTLTDILVRNRAIFPDAAAIAILGSVTAACAARGLGRGGDDVRRMRVRARTQLADAMALRPTVQPVSVELV